MENLNQSNVNVTTPEVKSRRSLIPETTTIQQLFDTAADQILRLKVPRNQKLQLANLFETIRKLRDTAEGIAIQDGVLLIQQEYLHAINDHGHTVEKDLQYKQDELLEAARAYMESGTFEDGPNLPACWPFPPSTFKPSTDDRIKELAKAGQFVVAEINRHLYIENINKTVKNGNKI